VSNANANYLLPVNNEIENKQETYVDPDIRLTRIHLPLLKKVVNNYKNESYNSIINEIIYEIDQKGIVDSQDVKEIIDNLNISSVKIYFLKSIHIGQPFIPFIIFPGFILSIIPGFYIGPSIF
jgi:hypothetical protein